MVCRIKIFHSGFGILNVFLNVLRRNICAGIQQSSRFLCDLTPFVVIFFTVPEFDFHAGRIMVYHKDLFSTAVTTGTVFIFQKCRKLLSAWLMLCIIFGNTEFSAHKARSTHEFQLQCCFFGERLCVGGCFFVL